MIRRLFLIIIYVFIYGNNFCQSLIPNGDFEQFISCPASFDQLNFSVSWFNPAPFPPGGSPDYYNACNVGSVNVPANTYGYQQAHSGDAYCGIVLWAAPSADFREYVETPLIQTLTAQNCYHFEMHISLSDMQYGTDDIQVYFSDSAVINILSNTNLQLTPQLDNPSGNYPDTSNWILVSGDYVAHGGESYIVIGNFKDDQNTDTVSVNKSSPFSFAYVYIDDVSLTRIAVCPTSLNEKDQQIKISVFPNPASSKLNFSSSYPGNLDLSLFDLTSRKVLQQSFNGNLLLDIKEYPAGIYFYEIRNHDFPVQSGKFLKQ